MITGMFDSTSLNDCADLNDMAIRDDIVAVTVETCHILNESTMQGIDPTGASEDVAVVNKVRFHHLAESSIILTRYPDASCHWRSGHSGAVWILKTRREFQTIRRCSRGLESTFVGAQSPL